MPDLDDLISGHVRALQPAAAPPARAVRERAADRRRRRTAAVAGAAAVLLAGSAAAAGTGLLSGGDRLTAPPARPAPAVQTPDPDALPPYTGPVDRGLPAARPAPTREEVEARLGRQLDLEPFLAEADRQPADTTRGPALGDLPGPRFVLFGWGDVENYQTGQQRFGPDDHVLRVVKRVGTGPSRTFYVLAFDPATGELRGQHFSNGGDADDGYSDLPQTPWRD